MSVGSEETSRVGHGKWTRPFSSVAGMGSFERARELWYGGMTRVVSTRPVTKYNVPAWTEMTCGAASWPEICWG